MEIEEVINRERFIFITLKHSASIFETLQIEKITVFYFAYAFLKNSQELIHALSKK